MALGLRQLVGYLFNRGSDVDDTLLGIVKKDAQIGYMTQQSVLSKYSSALRQAAKYATDPKQVKELMRGYGRSISQDVMSFSRDFDQVIDILGHYGVREVENLRRAKGYIGKAAELLYKGYLQKAIGILEKNVFDSMKTIQHYLSATPAAYEQTVKGASKKSGTTSVSKVAPMMAIIGFFALFLYSFSPQTTGQVLAFSGFNIYLIGIFTFISIVALYLIYKM